MQNSIEEYAIALGACSLERQKLDGMLRDVAGQLEASNARVIELQDALKEYQPEEDEDEEGDPEDSIEVVGFEPVEDTEPDKE